MEKIMEKEFNAANGVHVKMIVPIEVSEAKKQRKIEALYDALNTNEPSIMEKMRFTSENLLQKA